MEKGVFRRNQMSLANEQKKEDELSQLESADKFNRVMREQEQIVEGQKKV